MKHLYPFVVIIAIILFSCSKDNKVKIVEKNFEDEISVKSNLSITFSEDLIPDSLVGVWTEEVYWEITPKVEGMFNWQTNNRLVFIPRKGFTPSTEYTIKITNKITELRKELTYADDKEFIISTPLIEIESSYAYWDVAEEENLTPRIKFDISFSQKVNPSYVKDLITVEIDGESKEFTLESTEISNEISLLISNLGKEDKDLEAKITIKDGLTSDGGTLKTSNKYNRDFDIPSPFKLEITEVLANHDGIEGTITVHTTQKVTEKNLRNYLHLVPKTKYTIEVLAHSFLLKSSNFSLEAKYDITVKEGLTGTLGGELKEKFTQPVSFGKVEPTIRFNDNNEFYVSGKGSRNIEAVILNVPDVRVKITKLYENNIISYLKKNNFGSTSNTSYNEYYYDEEYYYNDYCYENLDDLGDVVFDKEYETKLLPRLGLSRLLSLDFEDKLADFKGLYIVEVKSKNDSYLKATKLVSVSDIGLIVKEGKNNFTVFANSIKTATPLSNVSIAFIGRNNQVNFSGTTDANGVLVYEFDALKASGFKTTIVSAKLGSDFNIIPLEQTRVKTSRFDVGGTYENSSGLEAFIYGDRNLYRPGETANISAIVRNYQWEIPGQIPVILKLTTPTGKNFKTLRKTLNKFGSFETSIDIPTSSVTGSYTVNIYTSNNILIGSSIIKVEEFMPDRIKVDVKLDKEEYKTGQEMDVDITATNFFGPPASGRNYQVEISTKRQYFNPKENRDYNYYIQGAESYFSNQYRDGETDEEGKAFESFEIPNEWDNMGILKSDIFTSVFDETGRPVNSLKSVKIYTQDVFYGLKNEFYYNKTGQPVVFDLIAVDKNGKPQSGVKAEIQLIKHEYKTVLSKSGKYFRYRSEKVERTIERKTITLNGKSIKYSYVPEQSGRYELKIKSPDASSYVNSNIYVYGWGRTSYSSFEVNKEGQIDIQLDKQKYNVGEQANVLLKTPFDGKVLITVETNKVLDYFYIETDKRAASFQLDINDSQLPNVYISATLFKPHDKSDIPLTVAHGFAPVKVENPENKIPVEISSVKKSRSNTKQIIKIKARPNSALTIAVVDEGILQVARYSTPNPYNFYYQKRALQVSTSNIYPFLFPEAGMTRSSTGGDGGEMDKRINPFKNERVKLVSFWSGIIETNGRGEAEYEINIPQFSGDLRIMAVSYGTKDFGSKHSNMKVADPLVMSVGLPRFLSPGDKVNVPVILTNTTEKPAKCKTTINTEGPINITSTKSETITIQPNSEAKVMFNIDTKYELGQAKISVVANAMNETFEHHTDITIRPSSTLQKRYESGSVKNGNKISLENQISDFMPSSIDCKLIVSKNPLVEFSRDLNYLVRYPYGCIEQTVSKAFPQLYFADIVNSVNSENSNNTSIKKDAVSNVQAALNKIKLMQLHNGGLTYWPGGGYESWWGSVYAAHFTVEAKKAGFEVDEDFLKHLLKYLKTRLKEKKLFTYYYNYNEKKEIAPKEVAYSLYVLTLAGEKPTSMMNYYRNHLHQLSLDGKYMLAASYALTGDKVKYKEILPKTFQGEKSVAVFGGSFYSHVRDEAIALNVLVEVDPENNQIGIMAKHISEYLKTRRYLNTQERTFSFLALGKIARNAEKSNVTGAVKANGKKIADFNNNTITLTTHQLKGKNLEIECSGSGLLYYFFEVEGISADGSYVQEDNFIRVRRNYYDRYGRIISGNTFKQNDLVLVEVNIKGLTDKRVENVAISDILPAGFEIENPRLTTLPPGMKYPHSRSHPEYMDIRDDRIIFFNTVTKYNSYYYYLVRAVTAGTFRQGPVGADAMYNGEYHSYHGGGTIIVEEK